MVKIAVIVGSTPTASGPVEQDDPEFRVSMLREMGIIDLDNRIQTDKGEDEMRFPILLWGHI